MATPERRTLPSAETPILNDDQDGHNSSSNTVVYTDHLRTHGSPTDASSKSAADDKVPGGGSPQASNAPAVAHHDEQLGLPIDAPSIPSTNSEPCPPPIAADDKVPGGDSPQASNAAAVAQHDEQVGLPIDAPSVPSINSEPSCPPDPTSGADDKVPGGDSPQASNAAAVAHHDEQVGLPIDDNAPSVPSINSEPSCPPDPIAADDKVPEGGSHQATTAAAVAHHDLQVGLPSASIPRETVSNIIDALQEEAENVKSDLNSIIDRISELLVVVRIPKESQKKTKMPTSAGFSKLKDLLLEAVNTICSLKDVLRVREANKVARDVVKGLGQAHLVTSGFLLVAYFLDRFETLSSNREGCLSLLEKMYHLAVDVRRLEGWKGLAKAEREGLAEDGTELIVKGSLICCTQVNRASFFSFLSTSGDQDDLLHFKEIFEDFNQRMIRRMSTWICSSLYCRKARPPRPREHAYPDHAVGIEEPFNNVTKLLQWERDQERAVAVIVHGFGGIGKSTLADAVFARYYVKDCKYSVVRLDSSPETANSSTEIVKLQKDILKDLMRSTEEGRTSEGTEGDENILDFNDFQDGRRKIGDLLKKEVAFLYLDNFVDSQSFEKLLPARTLKDAKKLRLLITTRDINVLNQLCNIKIREVHEMQALSPAQGKSLLSKQMCNGPDDINVQLTGSELDKMVKISDGVPKLLEMMAGYILSEPDKIRKSYDTVIKDSEKFTGDAFNGIEKYLFAYDGLPTECKTAFLDICYFFKGWEWETVANIVGESQLIQLQRRSLVSKKEDMISLNDVILTIVREKARDTRVDFYNRFDFTNATAWQIEEFLEKDMKYLELVEGLWFSDQGCNMPLKILNSMHKSLRIFGHKKVLEEGQCEKSFNELLVYKGETSHFPFEWSCLKNLRFLSYRPQNLKLLQEIPSSNLKHIELDGSECSVREISFSDIQHLQALQVLRLIKFKELKNLPGEWSESLRKNLKELTLSHCPAMKQLTGSISQLTSLKILKLDNCYNLRRWPKNCESLSSSLQKLNMWNCQRLKSLPTCFAKALDLDTRQFFQDKGILSDSPQPESDSDYESDED